MSSQSKVGARCFWKLSIFSRILHTGHQLIADCLKATPVKIIAIVQYRNGSGKGMDIGTERSLFQENAAGTCNRLCYYNNDNN